MAREGNTSAGFLAAMTPHPEGVPLVGGLLGNAAQLISLERIIPETIQLVSDQASTFRMLRLEMGGGAEEVKKYYGEMLHLAASAKVSSESVLGLQSGASRFHRTLEEGVINSLSLFSDATGLSSNSLGKMAGRLQNLGITAKVSSELTEDMADAILKTRESIGLTTEQMETFLPLMEKYGVIVSKSPEALLNATKQMSTFMAVLTGAGVSHNKVGDMISTLMDPTKISENAYLFNKMGISISEVVSGKGVDKLTASIPKLKAAAQDAVSGSNLIVKQTRANLLGMTLEQAEFIANLDTSLISKKRNDTEKSLEEYRKETKGAMDQISMWGEFAIGTFATWVNKASEMLGILFKKVWEVPAVKNTISYLDELVSKLTMGLSQTNTGRVLEGVVGGMWTTTLALKIGSLAGDKFSKVFFAVFPFKKIGAHFSRFSVTAGTKFGEAASKAFGMDILLKESAKRKSEYGSTVASLRNNGEDIESQSIAMGTSSEKYYKRNLAKQRKKRPIEKKVVLSESDKFLEISHMNDDFRERYEVLRAKAEKRTELEDNEFEQIDLVLKKSEEMEVGYLLNHGDIVNNLSDKDALLAANSLKLNLPEERTNRIKEELSEESKNLSAKKTFDPIEKDKILKRQVEIEKQLSLLEDINKNKLIVSREDLDSKIKALESQLKIDGTNNKNLENAKKIIAIDEKLKKEKTAYLANIKEGNLSGFTYGSKDYKNKIKESETIIYNASNEVRMKKQNTLNELKSLKSTTNLETNLENTKENILKNREIAIKATASGTNINNRKSLLENKNVSKILGVAGKVGAVGSIIGVAALAIQGAASTAEKNGANMEEWNKATESFQKIGIALLNPLGKFLNNAAKLVNKGLDFFGLEDVETQNKTMSKIELNTRKVTNITEYRLKDSDVNSLYSGTQTTNELLKQILSNNLDDSEAAAAKEREERRSASSN